MKYVRTVHLHLVKQSGLVSGQRRPAIQRRRGGLLSQAGVPAPAVLLHWLGPQFGSVCIFTLPHKCGVHGQM